MLQFIRQAKLIFHVGIIMGVEDPSSLGRSVILHHAPIQHSTEICTQQ